MGIEATTLATEDRDPGHGDPLYRFQLARSSRRLAEAARSFHREVIGSLLIGMAVFALCAASKLGVTAALRWSLLAGEAGLCFAGFLYSAVAGESPWLRLLGFFMSFYLYTAPIPLIWYEHRGRRKMRELVGQERKTVHGVAVSNQPADPAARPSKSTWVLKTAATAVAFAVAVRAFDSWAGARHGSDFDLISRWPARLYFPGLALARILIGLTRMGWRPSDSSLGLNGVAIALNIGVFVVAVAGIRSWRRLGVAGRIILVVLAVAYFATMMLGPDIPWIADTIRLSLES